jgi:deoxyribodipyrimidine photo-lyase
MSTLVLLNDVLRLTDNPLLCHEHWLADLAEPGLKIAVLVLDPAQWTGQQCQQVRASTRRLQQQLLLVEFFRAQLQSHGIALHCLWQPMPQAIKTLAHYYQARQLIVAQPVGSEEQQWLQQIQQDRSLSLHIQQLDANSLLTGDLAPELSRLPLTFSQFRRAREPALKVSPASAVQISGNWCHTVPVELAADWQLVLSKTGATEQAVTDLPTEPQQQQRFHHYLYQQQAILHYKQSRNGFSGAWYASFVSTALARGTLSARWLWQQILQFEQHAGQSESSYWLRFELLWREFFRWQLRKIGRQQFSFQGQSQQPLPTPAGDFKAQQQRFQRWCQGQTGVPIIDANMRYLQQHGLMSNRGRQLVASYLVFDLQLDWRWGAAFFEQQLLDYDVASNWGNWAYIAGAGPQPGRWFNSIKQALSYDPDAAFVHQMLPFISGQGAELHRPYPAAGWPAPQHPLWQPFLQTLTT